MTTISSNSKQNVVVTLVNGYHIWPKEGVVKCRNEEERLFDLMKAVVDVTCSFELFHIVIARLTEGDIRNFRSSPYTSTLLCHIAIWLCLRYQLIILLVLLSS